MMPLLGHIDLPLFDRGFYSKDRIMKLNNLEMNYLIFVPNDPQVKEEFTYMCQLEKKILLREFYAYSNGRRVNGSVHLAFLKQIFDHHTDAYYDWCFATNVPDADLDHIIAKYKFRCRIETHVPGSGRVPHKDEEQGHSCEIFENRGRKRDENQITAEKDLEISRLKDVIAEITLENLEIKKKDWRTLAEEGKDMKSMFHDIHRTVMNAVERAGFPAVKVLSFLGNRRSWYYAQLPFHPYWTADSIHML